MSDIKDLKDIKEVSVCECRKKLRLSEDKKRLVNRIKRIEGQVSAIRSMIESDTYCPDVLIQISAACSALGSLSETMLKEHINTCVLNDLTEGKSGAAEELSELVSRLMKK